MNFEGKRILITGGTGSLGKVLLKRLLSGKEGIPESISIFSRDEAKQHALRLDYTNSDASTTDEVIYNNFSRRVKFIIGDVRDYNSVLRAIKNTDIVFNAAALKQVPTCEYFPYQAVMTNIMGAENIVRAILNNDLPVECVVGISTDKAAKPVNVMGMTKSLQERVFLSANIDSGKTRFVLARYGNVLASRGSVIPLFHQQIKAGNDVTITDNKMTRFLLSLEEAVDVILYAVRHGNKGETFIPRIPSALVKDVAEVLIGDRPNKTKVTGIRPGEKMHEALITEEEAARTVTRGPYYVIAPILPEIQVEEVMKGPFLGTEYTSADDVMNLEEVRDLLTKRNLLIESQSGSDREELLR
ncbi:MAG: polysaccharide biosynthesis protein [Alphaproteobacteria bacterium]|nr:polysaccharide biosynthesis protein [Alphaproteobacteria bacterium]NCQ87660.1 polysaccharide biosynthesis protein [Alphaproteobacteria bacterium]NCT05831.1 polysaccharide biosynthesis protein [Alphaproteobacteria bacterium]